MSCENNTKTSSEIDVDWSTGTGGSGHHHYANVRFGSGCSSQASQSSSGDICRICHCEADTQNPLLTPCYCAGSLKYVHQTCLQQWLTASETNSCELCKFPFIMHTKIKPFNEWRSLDISGIERRRLCCSVLFHVAAALCVIWSLCVLIERAADDVQRGLIDWPFWTKLAVVTVGLTGGVVFMYIQCKAYLHLCHRWKARNRILLIQNAPEKVHPPASPVATRQHAVETHSAGGLCGGTVSGVPQSGILGGTLSTTAHAYNYATAASVLGSGIGGDFDATQRYQHTVGGGGHAQQQRASSPHHVLLQRDEHDLDVGQRSATSGLLTSHHTVALQSQHLQQYPQTNLQHSGGMAGQLAVAANIECSSQERDWPLDDVVSQLSSFRPCPQGSGSMTPFHNQLEHSDEADEGCGGSSSRGSRQNLSTGGISSDTTGGRSGVEKAPSMSSGVSHAVANGLGGFVYNRPQTKRYSNSSIFLENRDILNDSPMTGLDCVGSGSGSGADGDSYRHSGSLLTPPPDDSADCPTATADRLEQFLGKDLRRYSDTRLLGSVTQLDADALAAQLLLDPKLGAPLPQQQLQEAKQRQQLRKQYSDVAGAATVLDMELPVSPLSPPAAYACTSQQQQRQQRYQKQQRNHAGLRHSMDTVDSGGAAVACRVNGDSGSGTAARTTQTRLFFKSLPNLSSSCESLITK